MATTIYAVTPTMEVPLCGHATLESASVVMERLEPQRRSVTFNSASGPLPVTRTDTGYILSFPARPSERVESPLALGKALGIQPKEVFLNVHNYLVLVDSAKTLRGLAPDMPALSQLDRLGVIVTAPAKVAMTSSAGILLPQKVYRKIP